jgi:hypothetical protein
MVLDLAFEFIMELFRALLIEELCRRAREGGARMIERRRRRRLIRRAMHKITTEAPREL